MRGGRSGSDRTAPGRIGRAVAVAVLVLAGMIAGANVAIALAVPASRAVLVEPRPAHLPGVGHLRAVDEGVWRGDAPDPADYAALAAHGVSTVVDLRAERHLDPPPDAASAAGLHRVHLPVRDGQTPTAAQVAQFLEIVRTAPGRVYLHCGAGVGRTGAMAAAYLVGVAGADPQAALLRNLAVGPPSLEQIWYAATLDRASRPGRPPVAVSAVSRVLDAPRRMWSRVRE